MVVVLDDLQWADSSTFDLLDYVIATPRAARLLVIGAFRHDELDPERRARLATIASHAGDVHLEGLTVDGVEQLIRTIAGAARLPAARHRTARTNRRAPAVRRRARPPDRGRQPGGAPDRRDRGGDPPARRSADREPTSARGRQRARQPAAARRAGNRDRCAGGGRAAPSRPRDRRRPRRAASNDEFWFTHDVYRETLYAELDAADRSGLHGRIGAALEARSERGATVSPGDLAGHYAHAIATVDPGEGDRLGDRGGRRRT